MGDIFNHWLVVIHVSDDLLDQGGLIVRCYVLLISQSDILRLLRAVRLSPMPTNNIQIIMIL